LRLSAVAVTAERIALLRQGRLEELVVKTGLIRFNGRTFPDGVFGTHRADMWVSFGHRVMLPNFNGDAAASMVVR
jgi:hypothetical protein